jgi:hypothetical protein
VVFIAGRVRGRTPLLVLGDALVFGAAFRGVTVLRVTVVFLVDIAIVRSTDT